MPDNYEARIDEKVNLVEVLPPRRRLIEPDVAVTQREPSRGPSLAPAALATLEPVTLSLVIEEETHERHIEILHRPDRTLVAVLELLSPANKEEPGRTLYLAKRNALAHLPVHLIELDLLLKGQRLPLEEDLPPGDYYALVSRGDRRPKCQVYPWTMRQPLPGLPIPLLPPDPDVWIDLAAVFRTTYERGRYGRSIDYAAPPPVALDGARLAWVTERHAGVSQRNRRRTGSGARNSSAWSGSPSASRRCSSCSRATSIPALAGMPSKRLLVGGAGAVEIAEQEQGFRVRDLVPVAQRLPGASPRASRVARCVRRSFMWRARSCAMPSWPSQRAVVAALMPR